MKASKDVNETSRIVRSLQKLKPGFQQFNIFRELCRICVTPVVEIIPIRLRWNRVEVLLTKRSKNDVFWPDMFHIS
ncbi:hypothetical protein KJ918_03030 [Patescibacteria group bacterium]|nr:hypothetical protein [Patescibacteria group bacterium]